MEPTTGIEPVKPLPYQGSALPTELRGHFTRPWLKNINFTITIHSGAGDETRTRDIQLGRLKLYQLSYSRPYLLSPNNLSARSYLTNNFFLENLSKTYAGSHVVLNRSRNLNGISYIRLSLRMVVGGGFEPPKASPTDLQSVPFDHSGTPPFNS